MLHCYMKVDDDMNLFKVMQMTGLEFDPLNVTGENVGKIWQWVGYIRSLPFCL